MTVFGVSLVKDEADIIGPTIEHMLTQVDRIIVADNLSTDGTRAVLETYPIQVIDDDEPAHLQGQKMTALALAAMAQGADWIVPFDADEWWYSPFAARVADILEGLAPKWDVAAATLYNHVATRIDKADETDPYRRIQWREREPLALPKVACRADPELRIGEGNHWAEYPGGTTCHRNELVVRHFPYRSAEQMVRKVRNGARALAAANLPRDTGAHWRAYGDLLEQGGPEVIHDVFYGHFYAEHPKTDPKYVYDPVTAL